MDQLYFGTNIGMINLNFVDKTTPFLHYWPSETFDEGPKQKLEVGTNSRFFLLLFYMFYGINFIYNLDHDDIFDLEKLSQVQKFN